MKRWLPYPFVSLSLCALWLMLNQALDPANLLMYGKANPLDALSPSFAFKGDFMVLGFSPDSPLSPGDVITPLIASASGMALSGAALWALGRRPGEGDQA